MKTKAEEVDISSDQSKAAGVKWHAVRPPLLGVLITEVLAAAGLVALQPDAVLYWMRRTFSGFTIGLVQLEVILLSLACVAAVWAMIRARRGERFRGERLLGRTESEGFPKVAAI